MRKGLTGHITFAGILVGAALLAHCHVVNPTVSPQPAVITDQSDCAQACSNLEQLGCKEANPVDQGTPCSKDADCLGPDGKADQYQTCSALGACMVTCTNFCVATENTGVWLAPSCVIGIRSCSDLQSCPNATAPTDTSCAGSQCQVAPGNHAR